MNPPGWSRLFLVLGLAPIAATVSTAQVRTRFGLAVPMRDGVQLVADLWLPAGKGPFPAIVFQTPYQRTLELVSGNRPPEMGEYFARHGYAWMAQDTRGRGDSDGSFSFFHDDGRDGYDTIEWVARQSWSDGRVCTMGVSYMGTV